MSKPKKKKVSRGRGRPPVIADSKAIDKAVTQVSKQHGWSRKQTEQWLMAVGARRYLTLRAYAKS